METNQTGVWLCRNCNTLISNDITLCPKCATERGDEEVHNEPIPDEISEVVERKEYGNPKPQKSKYIFREAVLVNIADITLIIGIFCTFGSLVAPYIVELNLTAPMMWAIVVAVIIFATSLLSWALLRTVAEISRMLRARNDL